MNIFALIISLIFLVGVGLAVLVGILHGRKYKWQVSLGRIISVLISAVAAAFIASAVANFAISAVLRSFIESGSLGSLGDMFGSLPNGVAAVSLLGAMFMAPIIFIPIFLALKIGFSFASKILVKLILALIEKNTKPEKAAKKVYKPIDRKHIKQRDQDLAAPADNYVGAALGAVCSVLVLLVFMIPVVGNIELTGDIAPMVLNYVELDEAQSQIVTDAVEGVTNNAATFSVKYSGGKLLYGVMTNGKLDGEKVNLNKEGALFASVANAVGNNAGKTPEQKAENIRAIAPAFSDTVVSRILVTEICTAAGENWKAGESYYGIGRPSLGKSLKSLDIAMVEVLATSDKQNVNNDIKAITYAIAAVVEKDLAKDIESNPTIIISNEEASSEIFSAFLQDERHVPIVDALSDFGITMLMDSVKTPAIREILYIDFVEAFISVHAIDYDTLVVGYKEVFDTYGLRASEGTLNMAASAYFASADMIEWVANNVAATPEEFAAKTEIVSKDMIVVGVANISDPEKEADALAHAFAVSYSISTELKGDSFVAKNLLAKMGPALDSFAATETVGRERTGLMLKAMLQSERIHKQIGFTVLGATDTANSIQQNSSDSSYATIMTSLSDVVTMLEAASSAEKDTRAAVESMLANLTPESADVMKTMSSASMMKKYGVPERSAESSAKMISDTFSNLKNIPSDQYAGEAAAVSDMMNVVMSIADNAEEDTRATFGSEGTTKISEDEYVSNIMNSNAMSQTVVDTVYGGEAYPTTDPLDSQKKLSDTEKTNLMTSLNNKWQASEKDEQTKKEIISIAALMNLSVEIADDKVVEYVFVEPEPWQ